MCLRDCYKNKTELCNTLIAKLFTLVDVLMNILWTHNLMEFPLRYCSDETARICQNHIDPFGRNILCMLTADQMNCIRVLHIGEERGNDKHVCCIHVIACFQMACTPVSILREQCANNMNMKLQCAL